MIKKFTGVKYTPQEFRLLNECVQCGKASNISEGDVCDSCKVLNKDIKNCDMCEVMLRDGVHKFYTYDIKADHRGRNEEFKVSKEYVREFEYEVHFHNPENPEGLCSECVGWEKRMSNICASCGKEFVNSKEHYKLNGNYCGTCAVNCELTQSNESETTNNRLEGEGICYSANSYQRV